ncbi:MULTISPECIES: LamG-like jellyroll fold domain-containing protein [Streptomyces]|uniref:LamG-like jellyroll fold domain-containing protein n=1 Tax=Streptomyces TaxID=1883 RepID=UPI000BD55359|nr:MULTISPECIES: LamG-like jellyroll fold domain-containing protein [Streptomyces]MDX2550281.1 Ig-like domain-containing protein [Streptomyces stelliscabiei]MDX2609979.1 Ig-like domain-containing protein [Streptomyces stelliscabiei]MDX2635099.1 Ig-like domain-containing protein [Streptomyces stelliscabiei]MDX2667845.1 Ig-like domain-containing protein [Streptomyces stelliscabiei]MDX2718613.1 Ig-like domain-containing protein [Streptomyces stelliscabiei]
MPSADRSARRRAPAAVALTLGAGLLAAPAVPAQAADTPPPVARYTFDEDDLASGRIADSSGNGLTATLVHATTARSVAGADGGRALALPGGAPTSDGAYVRLPRAVIGDTSDLTVSARVKWSGERSSWQRIFDLGTDTSRYLFSTPYNGDGRLRTAVTTGGGGAEAQAGGYAMLPADAWKTVTVTLDTAAGQVTTYLDGVAVSSAETDVKAKDLLNASATAAGYIGKSFWPDPLLNGAIDDFTVWHAALSAEQVAGTVGDVPTVQEPSKTSFEVRTTTGTAPALPATVRSSFSDGYDRDTRIAWDAVPSEKYDRPGTFTVAGTAAGRAVKATVTVVREGQLTVDLGSDTGAFHGGASGTLYGVYGPDVPTNNLMEGMGLRTVSTKAQDGPQHPGADALEVVKPLADSTDGDVYIYMTDIHRGFPYQWPGDTPQEKLRLYEKKIADQVDQVLKLPKKYQGNIVFVPYNEPEGNMFGTGEWSYDKVSWLTDPDDFFAAWDGAYRLIKERMPDARIAGPNTSVLYDQVKGFLQHTVAAGTVPEVITWHELSHPEAVRASVAKYRGWEKEVFKGTDKEGTELPVNINEYAFNYHTSVPGQMIQWVSAIEESKVDADIAYWNIDGNLSDSAVQSNRGNGQWWLLNSYASMSGHTVKVTPPFPGENYTMQGVATLDEKRKQARLVFGGSTGKGHITFADVPKKLFGERVHAWVREIEWTGQLGDSSGPKLLTETDLRVGDDGTVVVGFGDGTLPALKESSAYEIVLSPAGKAKGTQTPPASWQASYEAEAAAHTGSGYSRNGPEGSPRDVSKFYTSGGYDVGGLRTGSDVTLDFAVDVPEDGTYDLSVFANSLNTFDKVKEQGPTNVFLRVDGKADGEQELHLPLGYKWVVWDHTDTKVRLTKGKHTLTLAARSLDGKHVTQGDAIVDRLTLSLPDPSAETQVYEGELAWPAQGAQPVYELPKKAVVPATGSGAMRLTKDQTATFWVYSPTEREATLKVDALDTMKARLSVNGHDVLRLTKTKNSVAVSLSGGVNKVTVTGRSATTLVDRLTVTPTEGSLPTRTYEAKDAKLAGSATLTPLSLATDGTAISGIGGDPGNGNTATFTVTADRAGLHALRIRYSNPEQSEATHYNPDPLARHADLTVNGGEARRVGFPHSFHRNNFWELTVPVDLKKGRNTLTLRSEELPNFDGTTYASDTFPGVLLRSRYAPLIDRITVAPYAGEPR